MTEKPLPPEYRVDIAVGIILSLVTCGMYNVYWNYKQMKALNVLLGREEYDFVKWLILSLITCGLYHVYYEYRMGCDLQEWLAKNNPPGSPNLSAMGLVLSLLGFTVIADAVYQHELNKLC